jgi:dodecin
MMVIILGSTHTGSGSARREDKMPDTVYNVVEIVGTSEQSISKAIEGAVAKASASLRHLGWFEVSQIRGSIEDGKVNKYQVTLKVGFTLE